MIEEKDIGFLDELENLIDILESVQGLYSDYTPKHSFEVEIDDDEIVLIFSSDIHFGSIYTDYRQMFEIWKTVLDTERVYLVVIGDFVDNFDLGNVRLLQAGINSQLITPALQREYFVKYISQLTQKKKILACVLGNHELFSHQYPYFSLLKNIPIASNRLLLNLKIKNIMYKIALIHKSRFNSFINPLHSNFRELTLLYPDVDIVVTSHTHMPALAVFPYPKDGQFIDRYFFKTGSLKNDLYITANFTGNQPPAFTTPAAVLSGKRREIIPFIDFRKTIEYKNTCLTEK